MMLAPLTGGFMLDNDQLTAWPMVSAFVIACALAVALTRGRPRAGLAPRVARRAGYGVTSNFHFVPSSPKPVVLRRRVVAEPDLALRPRRCPSARCR